MSLSNKLFGEFVGGRGAVALMILRVVAGLAMIFHGWSKIQNPFGWMGPESSVPGFFQMLAAVSEVGGGIFWILGLLTPLASLGILSTMAVATHMHAIVRGDPFVGRGGSYELALLYLCMALLFLMIGPGRLSLDALLFGRKSASD